MFSNVIVFTLSNLGGSLTNQMLPTLVLPMSKLLLASDRQVMSVRRTHADSEQ